MAQSYDSRLLFVTFFLLIINYFSWDLLLQIL